MRSLATAAFLVCVAVPAEAQSLNSRINDLFTFGDCGQPLCLSVGSGHGSHFIPAVQAGRTTVIGFVESSVGRSVASTPLSATSSGTTFTIVGGLPVQTSTSPGPIFGERSQTLGRGRFFLGAYVSQIAFTSLNGTPLDNIEFNFAHQNVGDTTYGIPDFENDHIAVQLRMDMNITSAYLNATWGVLDFMDVGVAIPFVRTTLDGSSTAQILPFGNSTVHNFGGDPANPILRATTRVSGSASGIGDVVGRVKINLGQGKKFGAALLSEVRFPTGNENDLLGAGFTSVRALGIASAQFGDFAPHLNVGYLARSTATVNDAFLATVGFDQLMAPWATFGGELITSWQVGARKETLPGDIVYSFPLQRRIPSTNVPNRRDELVNLSMGMKFRVRGGTVMVVNAMAPMRKTGMQPDWIWTAGLEGSF
ncbi:MAG: hypothetical protein ABI742_09840 [Gemmatimonadota bacterium]